LVAFSPDPLARASQVSRFARCAGSDPSTQVMTASIRVIAGNSVWGIGWVRALRLCETRQSGRRLNFLSLDGNRQGERGV
jgi:hypothetical protein